MKNFFIIFSFVFVLALMSLCSQSLNGVLKGEKFSEAIEVYPETDLGFVLEEKLNKSISYKDGDIVIGECVFLRGDKADLNRIADKLGLFITNRYEVEGKYVLEGVSNKVKYFIEGKRENIQISVEGDEIIVGSPIIYGSY